MRAFVNLCLKDELAINAEVTGKFIEVSPKTLDFSACVFKSVYQLSFSIYNKANIPHGVGIKFPSNLKDYLSSSENDVYIQANGHKDISIKFSPRKEIVTPGEISYYNPATRILQFPIYVCMTSRNFLQIPPTKLTIFAILTGSNGLTLSPIQLLHAQHFNEHCKMNLGRCTCESDAEYLIDMGECTTKETVYTELELTNNSYVFQNYGFLNLPEFIKILPNYGFGEIFPMEIKKLLLTFNPEATNISNYTMECETANSEIIFCIPVSTVKDIGGIKKKKSFKYKYIKKSLDFMEKELEKQLPFSLQEDISTCLDLLRDEKAFHAISCSNHHDLAYLEDTQENAREAHSEDNQMEQSMYEDESQKLFTTSNNLWIKAAIIDPLCDLSHQYIEFPDTPCGSYSIMTIFLRTPTSTTGFKCACGFSQKFSNYEKHSTFNAHFEIVGDNHEISIEPICGELENGQEIKLVLVARPQLSQDAIKETAKEIKKEKLIESKLLQWELKRQREFTAKMEKAQKHDKKAKKDERSKANKSMKEDKKDKKNKKGKPKDASVSETRNPEPEPVLTPEFLVDDNEIVVDYSDMYPAEMITWKNMEPYYIEAHFCCTVYYIGKDMLKKPEKLYFTSTCKVIRPAFIHNFDTQHINFGPVAVGMVSRRMISIQNIQYESINPMITLLSPTGSFICPPPRNLKLSPEHLLQLTLTFAPHEEKQEIEYFEIRAGSTVCPLVVSGEGVECNLTIRPDFVVCRLEANAGTFADCTLEIHNQSKVPATIEFIKICELEGEIKETENETAVKSRSKSVKKEKKVRKDKSGKSSKSTKDKKGKGKVKKINKFSQELSKEEEVSLQNYFVPKEGESYFKILGGNGSTANVAAFMKKTVKIHFGVPLPPEQKEQKNKKEKTDKKEGKKNKKVKASNKKSKSSKSIKKGLKQNRPQKYYATKFNIMLGTKLLRDAIIIATFT